MDSLNTAINNGNLKLIVEIYKYISPVFIWNETTKHNFERTGIFKQIKIFQLLKEMRNEASHFDISQNQRNESLFVKIVTIYKRFGLNLIKKSNIINRIWNDLHIDYDKRNSTIKLKTKLENIRLDYRGNYQYHIDSFKSILFSILDPNENDKNQYQINLINIIFQYISPIIIWHEKMSNPNKIDSKLFLLVDEIKNRVCHLSYINHENRIYLKEILKSIVVVYKIFGVDLKNYNSKIHKIDFETIRLCKEFKENDIKEEIIEILNRRHSIKDNIYKDLKELINQLVGVYVPQRKIVNHSTIEINEPYEKSICVSKTSNTKWKCILFTVLVVIISVGIIIFCVYKFKI